MGWPEWRRLSLLGGGIARAGNEKSWPCALVARNAHWLCQVLQQFLGFPSFHRNNFPAVVARLAVYLDLGACSSSAGFRIGESIPFAINLAGALGTTGRSARERQTSVTPRAPWPASCQEQPGRRRARRMRARIRGSFSMDAPDSTRSGLGRNDGRSQFSLLDGQWRFPRPCLPQPPAWPSGIAKRHTGR